MLYLGVYHPYMRLTYSNRENIRPTDKLGGGGEGVLPGRVERQAWPRCFVNTKCQEQPEHRMWKSRQLQHRIFAHQASHQVSPSPCPLHAHHTSTEYCNTTDLYLV